MEKETPIAVDIAFIPPQEIIDLAISVNRQGTQQGGAWITLGTNDYLPHVSLAMGGIQEKDIEAITSIITTICKNTPPLELTLDSIYWVENAEGHRNHAFTIKADDMLQKLHQSLMTKLKHYFSYDCTKDSLYYSEGESPVEPGYINTYLDHSFDKYDPHITLHTKELLGKELLPVSFTATTVGMYQIGYKTTCRREIFKTELE